VAMVLIFVSFFMISWNIYRAVRPEKASWEKALAEG
jgi:hypothetical protein